MKLTTFDSKTLPLASSSRMLPKFSIQQKNVVGLNGAGAKLLGLKPTDKISVAQDDDKPADWFVYKDNENGFPTRRYDNSKKGTFMFAHADFATMFRECFGLDEEKTYAFEVDEKPVKLGTISYFKINVRNDD